MIRGEKIKILKMMIVLICVFCLVLVSHGAPKQQKGKKRILVISSYHREYSWSKETNEGFCAALVKFGYFDNKEQAGEYTKNDYAESSRAIVKKLWMDAKRKSNSDEKKEMSLRIYKVARDFNPDIIFLGDDDAAEYIGKQFLDTEIPIVFWGVNNTPVKYGLVDDMKKPGHNVTGVYQPGSKVASLKLLKTIAPSIKTITVLSDATSAGRNHIKAMKYLAQKGDLPLKLADTVSTNDFEQWKSKALELQKKADSFFVAQYSGLKDAAGNYVPAEEVAKWYITHITIPEAVEFHQFIKQGMLCAADDSGYNQGYDAVVIAHDILAKGKNPATYPPRTPKRGALMVNRQRAKMLGITLTKDMGIEEYIEEASALKGSKDGGK